MPWCMDLSRYYNSPGGRDPAIESYKDARKRILNQIKQRQTSIKIEELEKWFNSVYYPDSGKIEEKYQKILDMSLQSLGTLFQNLSSEGLDRIVEVVGAPEKSNSGKTSIKKDADGILLQSKMTLGKFINVYKKFRSDAARMLSVAIKNNNLEVIDKCRYALNAEAAQCFNLITEFYKVYSENKNFKQYDNGESNILNTYIYNINTTMADLNNKGINQGVQDAISFIEAFYQGVACRSMNKTEIGTFWEEVIKESINACDNNTLTNFGMDVAKSTLKAGGSNTYVNAIQGYSKNSSIFQVQADILPSEMEEKETKSGKKKKIRVLKTEELLGTTIKELGDIEINSKYYDMNSQILMKADISMQLKNGEYVGISAKNWGSMFADKEGNASASNHFSAAAGAAIAQTFRSMRALYNFYYMLQDNRIASANGGRYTGKDALNAAYDMGLFATSISALMGLSQGEQNSANILMINDRTGGANGGGKIIILDITELLNDFNANVFHSKNRYQLKLKEDTYPFEAWSQAAYLLVKRQKAKNSMNGNIFKQAMTAIVQNKAVQYSLALIK